MEQTGYEKGDINMGFKLRLETPHGIILEEAYAKIDFFSFTAGHKAIIFNIVFYKDKEACESKKAMIPDAIIGGNIPLEKIDLAKDIRAQIYEYVKIQAELANGNIELMEYLTQSRTIESQEELNMQYALFKDAEDY